jgi:tRNA pseudouridine55 synthase
MDGVLVIDKPAGMTSHDVVAAARRITRETRIGHTGTLDPLATGVLPLVCGRATRLARFLTASDKSYDATIRFGVTTDSYDITGVETSRCGLTPSRDALDAALASLRGEYLQMPPAFSAKKVAGQRAYALARGQQPVALTAVPVRVSRVELTQFTGETAEVALTCSAGFYVRSFAHTLGEHLGTGACLERLRRTRSGAFTLERAITLASLQADAASAAGWVIPLDDLLPDLPAVTVEDAALLRVGHGRDLEPAHYRPLVPVDADWVRLRDGAGRLLALAGRGRTPGSLHPSIVLN